MFRTNLNRGGCGETERDDWFINGTVPELTLSPIGLKGAKLSIRPPVLIEGKGGKEDRRVGREGASGVFRRNN